MSDQRYRYILRGVSLAVLLISALGMFGQPRSAAVYIPYRDAAPILKQFEDVLPAELKQASEEQRAALWPGWVTKQDAEIRARLGQGDADTVVNFLLFGTSYTKHPRVTQKQIQEIEQPNQRSDIGNPALRRLVESLRARADDLIRAAASPGSNDRLVFTQQVLVKEAGARLDTPEGRQQARTYLLARVGGVLSEFSNYAKILASARAVGASEEFIERSSIFRTRGLSLDTTLQPNFAIEETLKAIAARGFLSAGSVRRVAIVGPGLDFTDKQEGYDFYPQQSIQPFAVADTLLRLRLARPGQLQISTLDLSPRINNHLAQARRRAQSGQGYLLHLPYDTSAGWHPELARYWEHFGDKIGSPVAPVASTGANTVLKVRALRVRPAFVLSITPSDANIVLQRLPLSASEQFDLIVATNILVYYNPFEQSLAVANIERMLRPGGFLLSNNAVPEFAFSRIRNVNYTTVVYSNRPSDGDHIVWYQRAPD